MSVEASTPGRPSAGQNAAAPAGRGFGRLGPVLAWAVVFADLGTSVYYVPGILYAQVGGFAAAFVLAATVAFVLVALEHMEIVHWFPRGGGGVAAAVEAFGPRVGVASGALMVSAYLLTIALSVVSAVQYLAALHPWPHEIGLLSAAIVVGLGGLNWIGVRAPARIALVAAIAALAVDAWLLVVVVGQLGPAELSHALRQVGALRHLGARELAVGFAGAWLAYSGLESLGQLAPALREPRHRVVRVTVILVVVSILLTVPLLTTLAVEAAQAGHIGSQAALLAHVAARYGGQRMLVAVALSGAALLLIAANVAFIGCYNVFQAIGEHGYLPAVVARRSTRTGTPRGAVLVITAAVLLILCVTEAALLRLGRMFAFGLLGSYAITSLSVDVIRWRRRRRGIVFWLGVAATLALVVPWVTSWVAKWQATLYAAVSSGVLLLIGLVTHRGWIQSGRFGYLTATAAETAAADEPAAGEVVTLAEAQALKQTYPSTTLVALRGPNPALCGEAARRARGLEESAVYVIYVDELPGLLFPRHVGPSDEALRVLRTAAVDLKRYEMNAIPLWRVAHDAGASIAEAAEVLAMGCVLIGTTQRSAVWHFLRGNVFKRLIAELPERIHVVICE